MGGSLSISVSIRELLLRQIYLNTCCLVVFSYFVYSVSACLSILLTFVMCFCLIYFILGNVSNSIEMYLGIFVNETETETSSLFMYTEEMIFTELAFLWCNYCTCLQYPSNHQATKVNILVNN